MRLNARQRMRTALLREAAAVGQQGLGYLLDLAAAL
jgi:hypothetical protein